MLSPKRIDVQSQLDIVVDMHYSAQHGDTATSPDSQCLPGLGHNLEQAVEYITDSLWKAQTGIISRTRALAQIGTFVSRYLHVTICRGSQGPTHQRACSKDLDAVTSLISMLSRAFVDLELDSPLIAAGRPAITATGMSETEVEDALEATFQRITHPAWDSRTPLELVPSSPIIQINSAITHVSDKEYYRVRGVTLAIREELAQHGFTIEVTSDYAAPRAQPTCAPDEHLTRAGIFRASGIVTIADHGRSGTATTLAIADELLIPTLVLYQDPVDVGSARYPGGFSRRTTRPYSSEEQAAHEARSYAFSMDAYIRARHALLCKLATFEIGDIQGQFELTDPAAFDSSTVVFERARFFTSDPVHWHQCPPGTRAEIERILGVRRLADDSSKPARPALIGDATPTAITALFVAAEYRGWTWDRVSHVYQRFLRINDRAFSPRKASWGFDDWIRFEETLP